MKTEIGQDDALQVGDVIEMHYRVIGGVDSPYVRAVQLALIENRLKDCPEYQVLSIENLQAEVIFTIRIAEPPAPELPTQQAGLATGIIIAAIVIGGGLFAWLSLDTIYKITASPAGQVAMFGVGGLGIAAAAVVLLMVLAKTESR